MRTLSSLRDKTYDGFGGSCSDRIGIVVEVECRPLIAFRLATIPFDVVLLLLLTLPPAGRRIDR